MKEEVADLWEKAQEIFWIDSDQVAPDRVQEEFEGYQEFLDPKWPAVSRYEFRSKQDDSLSFAIYGFSQSDEAPFSPEQYFQFLLLRISDLNFWTDEEIIQYGGFEDTEKTRKDIAYGRMYEAKFRALVGQSFYEDCLRVGDILNEDRHLDWKEE